MLVEALADAAVAMAGADTNFAGVGVAWSASVIDETSDDRAATAGISSLSVPDLLSITRVRPLVSLCNVKNPRVAFTLVLPVLCRTFVLHHLLLVAPADFVRSCRRRRRRAYREPFHFFRSVALAVISSFASPSS